MIFNLNRVFYEEEIKKTVLLLCLLIPFALILGTAAGVFVPLIISYNQNAYEEVDIVERSDVYIEPETDPQPSKWADITLREEDLGRDITIPNNVNGGGVNVTGDSHDRNASFGRNSNTVSVYGKTPIYKVEKKDPDIENILVLGTDSRDVTRERGRSDAMIILSYNKRTGAIKMVSVLRDSLVPIEGRGWNRIKAAVSGFNMESQHIPYSDAFAYKYYNGMAIISFDIDDAARRVNRFIYG